MMGEDPIAFHGMGGVILFHSPARSGDFYWAHVASDIERTERLLGLPMAS